MATGRLRISAALLERNRRLETELRDLRSFEENKMVEKLNSLLEANKYLEIELEDVKRRLQLLESMKVKKNEDFIWKLGHVTESIRASISIFGLFTLSFARMDMILAASSKITSDLGRALTSPCLNPGGDQGLSAVQVEPSKEFDLTMKPSRDMQTVNDKKYIETHI